MNELPQILIALAGSPSSGEAGATPPMLPLVVIIGVLFYLIVMLPARKTKSKHENMLKELKAGDKIMINPGIFGTVVAVEAEALYVRVDEKTRIKVLKSAVLGLQESEPEAQKQKEK
jgi:preprotein translocase subunit YajC